MKTKKTDPNNPLAGNLVFIHISNRKIAQQFESDLQLLGAVSTKSPKFDILLCVYVMSFSFLIAFMQLDNMRSNAM